MAKLPKAIIKKYGITKKAWSVYRANKRGGKKVAKRKTARKRTYRRKTSASMNPAIGALAYGLGREWTLGKLDPLLARVPVAGFQYVDEAAMFALSWAMAKGKIPFLNKVKASRAIGRAGMMIEAYRVGSSLAQNGFSFMQAKQTQTQSAGQLF